MSAFYETKPTTGMVNDEKKCVDLYIPRKCLATNKILFSQDKSSIQLNVGEVDASGRFNGQKTSLCLSGFVRSKGQSDSAIVRILRDKKVMPFA